jgi:serine/threonine-protein kinase
MKSRICSRFVALASLVLAIFAASPGTALGAENGPDQKLAAEATGILRKYCHRCHGVQFKVPVYDVMRRDILVAARNGADPYVTPGSPEKSELWDRMGSASPQSGDAMPPGDPKPTAAEKDAIKKWISAGAPFPVASARTPVGDREIIKAMLAHQKSLKEGERKFWRYFTLTTLYNNLSIRDDELRLARGAVSKLLNSLSRRPRIVVPELLGPDQTIMAVDIRRLGWHDRDVWSAILRRYPYGLKFTNRADDEELRGLAAELAQLVDDSVGLPDIRADWFIDSASRPPLYHAILDLPETARVLEERLGVDVEADFLNLNFKRAGFASSDVSRQNRIVDRHEGTFAEYYWKSYDFRTNEGAGNIVTFPLGPAFPRNPFPNLAFEHAGGEIIYSLPNKLQAYLLVKADGGRIDEGPTDIVGDDQKNGGTTQIVNGLSCIGCHKDGMRTFKDDLRAGAPVGGKAREALELLVPAQDEMNRLLRRDEALFLTALEEAIGPFVKVGDDSAKPIRAFPEPITTVAKLYQKDLGLEEMVAELGLKDGGELRRLAKDNRRLRTLGLGVYAGKGAVKRSEWDSLKDRTLSVFHQAAIELGRGTPYRSFGSN